MHFRAPDNSIHYLDDPAFLRLLPAGSVAITDAQAAEAQRPAPTVESLTALVQAHIDAVAQAWGYDNVYTAVTYADEPAVKAFADEGKALRAWRSRVWAAARQTLADVQSGKTPPPTIEEFITSLPAIPARP